MPRSRFQEQLRAGQTEFLRELSIDEDTLSEALRLGSGAPFYLAQVFLGFAAAGEHAKTAEGLLLLQWQRGQTPWREEAALQLVRRYLDADRHRQAEQLAKQFLRRRSEPEIEQRMERELLEALYWQRRDEEVLEALERRRAGPAPWDDELDLFEAVSAQSAGKPRWQDRFVDLFFHRRASGLHARAYAYLQQEQLLSEFPPAVAGFIRGKYLLYRGQNAQAVELLPANLSLLEPRPDMEILIRELGAAYFAMAEYGQGTEALLELGRELPAEQRLYAVEMAGRLLRKGGDWREAQRLLRQVVEESSRAELRDRAAWFMLDMAASRSSAEFVEVLGALAPGWRDAEYFSDILERQISALVARRDWSGILALYAELRGYGPADAEARLAYLLGRLGMLGLADTSVLSLSPRALFLEAREVGEGYHELLAEAALVDLGYALQWTLADQSRDSATEPPVTDPVHPDTIRLIRGYFDFGLLDSGVTLLRSHWRSLPAPLLREIAADLNERGAYLSSIRLMNLHALRMEGEIGREDLELTYPRAYGQWIEELAAGEDIPKEVFFALVREESYFDPQIVSRSGAVGLTQLMSETAADTARWLRMQEYDLRNPEDNLRIGARHFSRLLGRLEDIPKALMAYNAGLSRLRRWERSYAGLPHDLLAEAAPYPETRNYVRKILVSAVYYGALYYDQPPDRTVLLFFPQLAEQGSR